MAWKPIYESEQLSLIVDDDKQVAMLEVSSGGFVPSYITFHWSEQELAEIIQALQNAQQELKGNRA
ncbi:hypothetical protein SAMN03159341_11477 [Paenibacillus sp. 1_12]|uniref:hypothetical protein n=1 Tax=Paenibacillus sp. 1_12 TaxID=1566278 RepID=UPI0008ECA193|nr:hypothetical protein [Paenibacillus sp. 1_12]SFM02593.1 hypothetical protein SAMN03159341_11477 [Paenibacillus sp. 1_12]